MKKLISELRPHPHQHLIPPMTFDEYKELKEDIQRNGILQPIDIKHDGTILDGHHRYKAAKELGIKEIEVRIPELIDIDEDEYLISVALNRRHLSEGQKAYLSNEYSKVISEKRKIERGKKAKNTQNAMFSLSETVSDKQEADKNIEIDTRKESAAKFNVSEWKLRETQEIEQKNKNIYNKLGTGELTIYEAKKIADLPEGKLRETQEIEQKNKNIYNKLGTGELTIYEAKKIADLPEGKRQKVLEKKQENPDTKIISIIREVNNEERINTVKPIPIGKYSVIYADPPWKYEFTVSENRAIENQYPTMSEEDIKNLKLPAADDCILFLWVPPAKLDLAIDVIRAWDFTYRTSFVWVKDKIGMGYYVRNRHEYLLIAVKGNIGVPLPEARHDSVIEAPRTEHSKKPDVFYEIIERMYPNLNKIELFARNKRAGWDTWGNENV